MVRGNHEDTGTGQDLTGVGNHHVGLTRPFPAPGATVTAGAAFSPLLLKLTRQCLPIPQYPFTRASLDYPVISYHSICDNIEVL